MSSGKKRLAPSSEDTQESKKKKQKTIEAQWIESFDFLLNLCMDHETGHNSDMDCGSSESPDKRWKLVSYLQQKDHASISNFAPVAFQLYNIEAAHIAKWHSAFVTNDMKAWLEDDSNFSIGFCTLTVENASLARSLWTSARPFDKKEHTNPFVADFVVEMNTCLCNSIEIGWVKEQPCTLLVKSKALEVPIEIRVDELQIVWNQLSKLRFFPPGVNRIVCEYIVTLENFMNFMDDDDLWCGNVDKNDACVSDDDSESG